MLTSETHRYDAILGGEKYATQSPRVRTLRRRGKTQRRFREISRRHLID